MNLKSCLLVALLLSAACSTPTTAAKGAADVGGGLDVAFGADIGAAKDVLASSDAIADVADAGSKDTGVVDALADAAADIGSDTGSLPDASAVDVQGGDLADTGATQDGIADVAPDVVPDIVPDIAADIAPDLAPDLGPDLAQDIAPDLGLDPVDVEADIAAEDVPLSPAKAGCADGSREGFADTKLFAAIAACGGAWDQAGIFNMPVKCNREAGNDGKNAPGIGCTVSDLCAQGWHVCYGKDDVVYRNGDGCLGVLNGVGTTNGKLNPVFFTSQMSSTGAFECKSGADASNDLFGCGNLGCDFTGNATVKALCAPLSMSSHDQCKGLRNDLGCGDWCNHLGKYPGLPNSWNCGSDTTKEALNVKKTNADQQGGVLCCLD